MKQKMRTVALLLAILFSLSAFSSVLCEGEPETRAFTDSLGRTVTVPAHITRIAVTGPVAQIVVFALCPDRLVGIATAWDPSAEQFLRPDYYDLPVLGQLYGGKSEMNPEALLASGAEIVIDIGEPKASAAEDLDALTAQTGIPFIHITASTGTVGSAYRLLGELLEMPDEAEVLAVYCETTYEKYIRFAERIDKVRVLYLLGDSGLNVIARGSYHAEVIDLMCDNIAIVDSPSSKGTGNEVDMEQILLWDPDVILFAPESIYATVGDMEEWQTVSAVQSGKYYEVPFGPYNWMGFPPSVQRFLGLFWLGALLYPEEADYDLEAEVMAYFRLFCHCELSHDQYLMLVANSMPQ